MSENLAAILVTKEEQQQEEEHWNIRKNRNKQRIEKHEEMLIEEKADAHRRRSGRADAAAAETDGNVGSARD